MLPIAAPAAPAATPTLDTWHRLGEGVLLSPGARSDAASEVLTEELVQLVATLHRELDDERRTLLARREERQARWDAGELPAYLDRGSEAVTGDWAVADVPADLQRRRVEITGPVNDPKMVIKMLSRNDEGHRADTAMLDFEDSMKPAWVNVIAGVCNVRDAIAGRLTFVKPGRGGAPDKVYALDPADMAKLMVRVRGLHLEESNLRVDGRPVAGGLFDFVACMVHAARTQAERGETPTFYVPKCEHHEEAAWWNRLFVRCQDALGLECGTLRATFLIETLPAAFQMEEILFAFREHAAGLNVGRWDKIFSDIKVLKMHPDRVMADRSSIGLNRPWMREYAMRLIAVCHRRGAYAIGGMAAFTPGRTPDLRRHQTSKVLEDKRLEAEMGHDGCWVSHPYFIGPALSAFEHDHQLDVQHADRDLTPDLLPRATSPRTLDGLRTNVRVGIAYLEGWRRQLGCVAWDDLMEDLATLEISRAQVWQWLHHGVELDAAGGNGGTGRGGHLVDEGLVHQVFEEELRRIHAELDEQLDSGVDAVKAAFSAAREEAERIFLEREFRPFLATASELA